MDADARLAAELQKQFDEEDKKARTQEVADLEYAKQMSMKDEKVKIKNTGNSSSSLFDDMEFQPPTIETKREPAVSVDTRPVCKYGSKCFRKNPTHLEYYKHEKKLGGSCVNKSDHSEVDEKDASGTNKRSEAMPVSTSNENVEGCLEPPLKKRKAEGSNHKRKKKSFSDRWTMAAPYYVFMTKSYSVPATHNDPLSCVLPDLLHPSMGTVVKTLQLSFLVDMDFLHENYNAVGIASAPLLLLYGELEGDQTLFTNATLKKVSMPFLYGTHHTKMMILHYQQGLRVIIHTANIRPDDWYEKTQGLWVSPLFPKLESSVDSTSTQGDSVTQFRQDLLEYLRSYKLSELTPWLTAIQEHDFTDCNAVFIGHSPGYHKGPDAYKWGHLKLRRTIARASNGKMWRSTLTDCGITVAQCSSIGSLGSECQSWLSTELGKSLNGGMSCPANKLNVVYPSEEDVRCSSQGWSGGSCLPYNSNTHSKQPWLQRHLCKWRSGDRTPAMPHIKTYTRLTADNTAVQYLLLTSANVSKAAWGQLQKQESQLFIRSYETGVLLLPKFVLDKDSIPLSGEASLRLPYELPLTPYTSSDKPWLMNTNKTTKDCNGHTYP